MPDKPMTRRRALALALLALDDQARQPDTLADEFYEAGRVLRGLLRQERGPTPQRPDLPVVRSNFGMVDRGI